MSMESAASLVLDEKEVTLADLEQSVGQLMHGDIDFGEVFVQKVRAESWGLEDGIVKDGSFSVDAGIGVRALSGEKTGFA